ncbi:MAG TPA: alpha/beta hydrolase [Acetobacteraceae bacterium]|nr:alpha/beta hydrolase [Acetobacteraceae bacterium]
MASTGRLDRGDGVELAWTKQEGSGPTLVFLPGFRSDMAGDKATALAAFCAMHGHAMLRFDYSGHGISGGRFEDGTISVWTEDALIAMDSLTAGPLILVGSSMGGWIALLCALARRDRVAALVGIAAAPDFTETLMSQALSFKQHTRLVRDGVIHLPSQYGDPAPITRALIEDGRNHLLLSAPIVLDCPVRLLHGQADPDVPWEMAMRIADRVTSTDVRVTVVKDGDHRLSRPSDLALLCQIVSAVFLAQDGG